MKYLILAVYFLTSLSFSLLPAEEPVVVTYFAEWGIYGRNYHVADLPAEKLTHVIYAFAKISPEGEVVVFDPYAATEKSYPGDSWNQQLRGSFNQLRLLKEKYPHLKTLIAIGGWTLSDPFTDIALSAQSREKFAASAVDFVAQYGFDGIDIDWEYPVGGGIAKGRPEDTKNLTLLVAELRSQLKKLEAKTQRPYLLTIASPAGDQLTHYELSAVSKYIDWYNLMAYDFHGSWEKQTNHQAALYPTNGDTSEQGARYTVAAAVDRYLNAGVLPSQIALGVPLYSRGWSGVATNNNGLFQSAKGASQGTWENGILDYSDLHKKIKSAPEKYLVYNDSESKATWVFNPYMAEGSFYTYEDVATVKEKVKFIKDYKLRGAMFWEASGDIHDANDPESIIGTVHRELKK